MRELFEENLPVDVYAPPCGRNVVMEALNKGVWVEMMPFFAVN